MRAAKRRSAPKVELPPNYRRISSTPDELAFGSIVRVTPTAEPEQVVKIEPADDPRLFVATLAPMRDGNPRTFYFSASRTYEVLCPMPCHACGGKGSWATKEGEVTCGRCEGSGEEPVS